MLKPSVEKLFKFLTVDLLSDPFVIQKLDKEVLFCFVRFAFLLR